MSETLLVKQPLVANAPKRSSLAAPVAGLAVVGLAIFFWLSEARASIEQSQNELPSLETTSTPAPAQAPPAEAQPTVPPAQGPFLIPNSGPVTLVPTPSQRAPQPFYTSPAPIPATPPGARSPSVDRTQERLRAPALVVDLAQLNTSKQQQGAPPGNQEAEGRNIVVAAPEPAAQSAPDPNMSDTDRFTSRVRNEEVEVASARRMAGLDRMIPQGAIIGAVMETALNSDLPGYARAVTQRDVYSFDGSAVLIPAGSRLVGQYKSGIAQGGSRVFVLWTRLIRADGVSIDLASPATDELGRGGLGGKVNRHFLQRFGGAILTSVLTGGISAASAALSGGSTIIVGSSGQAASLAGQAAQNGEIPPTITTRQGAAVRVFVARDLDFSLVGPVR